MKKLIINSLALFILIAGFNFTQTATAISETGKITASATESTYVTPDSATVSFTVETTDKNSQKAVAENNKKTTALINAIKASLAQNETIKTTSYNLRQNYEYNNILKKNVLSGYALTNTITVKLKDITKTGEIIDIATKNGATNVNNLSFSLEDTNAICKELTQKAVLKAKEEAQTVLAPLGKTIDNISTINYACSSQMRYSPYRNYAMLKSSGMETADTSVSIEEGETKVEASVTIVFTIK